MPDTMRPRLRYDAEDLAKAKSLRNGMTDVERKLWWVLREQAKLYSLHFRRQCPIHPYIADFACLKARLLIELDGRSHDDRQDYDCQREGYLRAQGYEIIRFTNNEVLGNAEGVVLQIVEVALQRLSK